MNSTLFYNTSLGPPVGDPAAMYAPPLRYKREALAVQNRPTRTLTYTGSPRHSQTLSRQGNTTHSGCRVLRSGGPNHSKSLVFIVFLSEIELGLANPRIHTLWARAGAFRHPAVVCSTTTLCGSMEGVACCCAFVVEQVKLDMDNINHMRIASTLQHVT